MATGAQTTGQLIYYCGLSILCVLGLAAAYPGFDWVAAFILILLLCVSFAAIVRFLPGSTAEKGKKQQETGSVEPNKSLTKNPPLPKESQKPDRQPKHYKKKLDEQKRKKEQAQEEYKRLRQRITAQFPYSKELLLQDDDIMDPLESGRLQKEGFLRRIEALAPEGFNVPEAGIGLEQSLMHLYGIELYAFLKALQEQKKIQLNNKSETQAEDKKKQEADTKSRDESEPESMEAVIEEKCTFMNTHLRHVELVNMGLQVPYNPASHQVISGTPKQGMPVEVCSFKILNRRGQGQLLKALVRMPKP